MIPQGSVFLTFSGYGRLELGFASGIGDAEEPIFRDAMRVMKSLGSGSRVARGSAGWGSPACDAHPSFPPSWRALRIGARIAGV